MDLGDLVLDHYSINNKAMRNYGIITKVIDHGVSKTYEVVWMTHGQRDTVEYGPATAQIFRRAFLRQHNAENR